MHAPWLTIHELAKALKVSIKTVRRAYLRGEIPVQRIFRFVRFDLEQVKEAMRRNGETSTRGFSNDMADKAGMTRCGEWRVTRLMVCILVACPCGRRARPVCK